MNMQALMRQAQQMQKDIMNTKNEIDNMIFEGKSSLVTVKINGAKKVLEVKIVDDEEIKKDLSFLEDMIVLAFNDALEQVDKVTEQKLGKYSSSLPGLF